MDPRHRSFFNKIQVKILESKFLVEFRFGEKRNNKRFDLSPGYYKESFFCLADEIPKKVLSHVVWLDSSASRDTYENFSGDARKFCNILHILRAHIETPSGTSDSI